ncbi:radical SAM family heme chaperone HemW [Cyclobacterium sp.]|uniref:radical SAM family heme chaperone HemW n=1 Tax=Cyclobacterium sp. TaxID=1966343 RepID=UPI001988CD91|nr:radical SAM family heme chaperone HemW [Cyclobacterium sp.]MBD3628928.1 radical SAM family heme chaperone HemW [Cyclobacterium sp.]
MAGIYIHIPFCLQACHYCDFHFSTNRSHASEMVSMICRELELRKHYLSESGPIHTIYFGGGTPSLLPADQIAKIYDSIQTHFDCELQETTLEANPDDLIDEKLDAWLALGVDRLSIGIQSFNDDVLKFYNRSHNAKESLLAIDKARKAGFQSLSMDLIYGFPHTDHHIWQNDLDQTLALAPNHISSYCLTIEPQTALGVWEKKGKFKAASEDFQAEQFEILQGSLERAGYLQYEISNFARNNAFSRHNSNYWKGIPYLGIGPGAHSFDGNHRGYNVSNNMVYIRKLKENQLPYQKETLSADDQLNEYLLTSMRTIWGIDNVYLVNKFGWNLFKERENTLSDMQRQGLILVEDQSVSLSRKGKLLADYLASKLFI